MNLYDSHYIKALLINRGGFVESDNPDDADIVVVNGCVVREHAQNRAVSIIKKISANKTKQQKLIVTGCLGKYVENTIKGVDIYTGPAEWSKIADFIGIEKYEDIVPIPFRGVSQFITIMKGCNNFCRYCVVPYLRGKEESRSYSDLEREIKEFIDKGYISFILLGQNVNAYRHDYSFAQLLEKLSNIKGLQRISFLTSHPEDFSAELIDVINNNGTIMPYIHLPAQSFNDRILKLMNRKYTVKDYLALIEKIRKSKREISLSTDIMVGYPTETEKDFTQILQIFKDIRYDTAYMYAYSPRAWTVSSLMEDVPEKERKRRLSLLIEVQNKITLEKNEKMVGKVYKIITEKESTKNKGEWFGFADNGKPVVFAGESFSGELCEVKIKELRGWTPYGQKINN